MSDNRTDDWQFYDILTPQERHFCDTHGPDTEMTKAEVRMFNEMAAKAVDYSEAKTWIRRLAWQCVRDVDPQALATMADTLYEAYVWAQREH